MEATENEGIDAEVRTTDGPTSLQKHVIPYNFLHRMPVEALCSARARLLLLVGHRGCEGGTWEREPPGLTEPLVGGSRGAKPPEAERF